MRARTDWASSHRPEAAPRAPPATKRVRHPPHPPATPDRPYGPGARPPDDSPGRSWPDQQRSPGGRLPCWRSASSPGRQPADRPAPRVSGCWPAPRPAGCAPQATPSGHWSRRGDTADDDAVAAGAKPRQQVKVPAAALLHAAPTRALWSAAAGERPTPARDWPTRGLHGASAATRQPTQGPGWAGGFHPAPSLRQEPPGDSAATHAVSHNPSGYVHSGSRRPGRRPRPAPTVRAQHDGLPRSRWAGPRTGRRGPRSRNGWCRPGAPAPARGPARPRGASWRSRRRGRRGCRGPRRDRCSPLGQGPGRGSSRPERDQQRGPARRCASRHREPCATRPASHPAWGTDRAPGGGARRTGPRARQPSQMGPGALR